MRQVPTHHSHSASLVSRIDFSSQTPAELTRMSRRPKPLDRLGDEAVAVGDHGDVAEHDRVLARVAVASRARAAARAATACVLGRVPAADGDAHALLREPVDDRLAEARGAAGDEGHLAVQSAHRSSYWAA